MRLDDVRKRLAAQFAKAATPCDVEALRRVSECGAMFAQAAKLNARPDLARQRQWDAVDRADTRARLWQWRAVARTDDKRLALTAVGEAILMARANV